jgi:hypothetical protein
MHREICNCIGCEKEAKYEVGQSTPYMESYFCEEHKNLIECIYCERLEED